MPRKTRPPMSHLARHLGRLGLGARNALSLAAERRGRHRSTTPYTLVSEDRISRLRHYDRPEGAAPMADDCHPLLLVPPLMVTSEIYDISPALSAAAYLVDQGLDVWLVDFGAPERQAGGMKRTLDDHVLAIDHAIDEVHRRTQRPLHLVGYSQGGLFCYQAAAYRQSRDLASVVTFGGPVDIYRNLPLDIHEGIAGRFLQAAGAALEAPLELLPGVSATLSSGTFKVLFPGNQVKQLLQLIEVLPDRQALDQMTPKRQYLSGGGFVAWPGPAFREFFEQVITENRMVSGGFVVNSQPVTLADITCPVLYFYGSKDQLARPSAVKAIARVAPHAEKHGVEIRSGHFGLVVGSKAMSQTWPLVADWVRWTSGAAGRPPALSESEAPRSGPDDLPRPEGGSGGRDSAIGLAADKIEELWRDLGHRAMQAAQVHDALRWQLPRLLRLEMLRDTSRANLGRILSHRAWVTPEETFFLWGGHAYTYAEAHRRVRLIAGALHRAGAGRGQRVGVIMSSHTGLLAAMVSISRLGAVSVLIDGSADDAEVTRMIAAAECELVVADPDHAALASRCAGDLPVCLSAMGAREIGGDAGKAERPAGLIDLDEIIARGDAELPASFTKNPGLARDLAVVLFAAGAGKGPRPVPITNREWLVFSLGVAADCRLTPKDTVYSCLPLSHVMNALVALGAALSAGARLALAPKFSPETFWDEIRRTGATVVPCTGELCRALVQLEPRPGEDRHPVRIFVGHGVQPEVWHQLHERFGDLELLNLTELG